MNAATRMNGLKQSLSTFWEARNKREQNMLLAAVAAIVLGLIYALLIDPALSGREDLENRLPALRQQAAEVRALAKEAGAAGSAAAPVAVPPMTRESIETSLSRHGLKAQNVSATGEMAKIQLSDVSFVSTVEWLADLQRTGRITVVDAKVDAQPQADSVNVSLTLRQQRNE